jgi:predicted enzyme related to lactoylglutathione lyase
MAVITKYKPGEFCWSDLGTTDVAGAKKFYRGIFGCTFKDFPMAGTDETYSMLRVGGKDIAAIFPMPADMRKAKVKPSWNPFISVKSASGTAKKVKAAGGKVIVRPTKVMDAGHAAKVQDPSGATFGLWQPGKHKGAGVEDKPGTVKWHDLNTFNTKAAGKFYAKVFGWKIEEKDFSGNKYYLFLLDGEDVCGMWPEPSKTLGSSWLTHWQVANCAKTVAKVKRLGGRIILGATPIPGMGHFAIVTDPKGAAFGLIGK